MELSTCYHSPTGFVWLCSLKNKTNKQIDKKFVKWPEIKARGFSCLSPFLPIKRSWTGAVPRLVTFIEGMNMGGRDGAKWLRKTCSWSQKLLVPQGFLSQAERRVRTRVCRMKKWKRLRRGQHPTRLLAEWKTDKTRELGKQGEALWSFPVGWEWGMTRCAGASRAWLSEWGRHTGRLCIHALFSKAPGWLILWKVKNNKLSNKQK